jgi:hypothetical protein
MFNRSSSITPAIIKIQGDEADVAFLDICMKEILPGCTVRTERKARNWFKPTFVVDLDDHNEIAMTSPSDLRYIDVMARQLHVQIISFNYGSIKPDDREPNKCEMTFEIWRNGRREKFDLSVR